MLKTSTYVDVLKFRRFLSITLLRRFFYSLSVLRTADACVCVREYTELAVGTYMEAVQRTYVKHVLQPMAIRGHVYV